MNFVDVEKREIIAKRSALMDEFGPKPYHCIRFSPDSQYLAAGNLGGKAAVWKVEDLLKPESEPIVVHAGSAYLGGVGFSPDSEKVVTGSWDGSVRFWDPETGKEIGGLLPSRSPIESIAWSSDGKLIATGHQGGAVTLWDRKGAPLNQLEGEKSIMHLAFSPKADILAASHRGGLVEIWNLAQESDSVRADLAPLTQKLSYFVPTQELLVVDAVEFGRLIDPETGSVRRIEKLPVDVSKEYDGHALTVSGDQTLAAARLMSKEDREKARGPRGRAIKEAVPITVWEIATGSVVAQVTIPESVITLRLSPGGKILAVNSLGGRNTRLVDLASGKIYKTLRTGFCKELVFSPSGSMLVALGEEVTVWDVRTGRRIKTYPNRKGRGLAAAFSPTEDLLAIADETNAALVWDFSELKVEPAEPATRRMDEETFESAFAALSSADAAEAHQALWSLAQAGISTLEKLDAAHLEPFGVVSEDDLAEETEKIRQAVRDLTSGSFKQRQSAFQRLEDMAASAPAVRAVLGEQARKLIEQGDNPALKQRGQSLLVALNTPLPTSSEALRVLRTAKLLEAIGGEEARAKLARLAGQTPGAWVNGFARAALGRMETLAGNGAQ
jgi:WD40 repeat protein